MGCHRDPREAMDQSAALTAASSVGDGPEDIANFTEGVRTLPSSFLLPASPSHDPAAWSWHLLLILILDDPIPPVLEASRLIGDSLRGQVASYVERREPNFAEYDQYIKVVQLARGFFGPKGAKL